MQFPGLLQLKKPLIILALVLWHKIAIFFWFFPNLLLFCFCLTKEKDCKKNVVDWIINETFVLYLQRLKFFFRVFFIPEGKQFISYIMNYCFCFFKLNNSLKLACNVKMNFIILNLFILLKGIIVKANFYQIWNRKKEPFKALKNVPI